MANRLQSADRVEKVGHIVRDAVTKGAEIGVRLACDLVDNVMSAKEFAEDPSVRSALGILPLVPGAGKKADELLGGGSKGGRGGRDRALSGRSAEDRVSEATGIPANRGPARDVDPGTGPGGIRIPDMKVFGPDASLTVRGSIIEVKNVTRLRMSQQLRDLAEQAKNLGGHLEIFTNAPAPSRGELARLIQRQEVILHPIP